MKPFKISAKKRRDGAGPYRDRFIRVHLLSQPRENKTALPPKQGETVP